MKIKISIDKNISIIYMILEFDAGLKNLTDLWRA